MALGGHTKQIPPKSCRALPFVNLTPVNTPPFYQYNLVWRIIIKSWFSASDISLLTPWIVSQLRWSSGRQVNNKHLKRNQHSVTWGSVCSKSIYSNYSIIRVTLNTESDTLQRSFFHAHAIEWIIVNVVSLESWFAKVRCIHLLRSLSWIFQQ